MLESLFTKETTTQMFYYEICEIFKNIYLQKHLRTASAFYK